MTQLQAVSWAGRAGGRGFTPEFSPATPLVATISGAFVFLFVCFFLPRRRPKCSMVMKRNGAERVWLPHWQLLISRPSAMEKRKRKNTFWDVTVCPSPRFFFFVFSFCCCCLCLEVESRLEGKRSHAGWWLCLEHILVPAAHLDESSVT